MFILKRLYLDYRAKFTISKFQTNLKNTKQISKLESKILSELNEVSSIINLPKILADRIYLDLDLSKNTSSVKLDFAKLYQITKNRGLLRWLCWKLLPEDFVHAYEISRMKLTFLIIKNYKNFLNKVISKVIVSNHIVENFELVHNYEFTHPFSEFRLEGGKKYLLVSDLESRLEFTRAKSSEKIAFKEVSDFLLGRMILWDSTAVSKFLIFGSIFPVSKQLSDFLLNFPDFFEHLSSLSKMKVRELSTAKLSFDERVLNMDSDPDLIFSAEIWNQRFIVSEGEWILFDSTTSPGLDFVAGHWQFIYQFPGHQDFVLIKKPQLL